MGDDFHAAIKLVSGEELFAQVMWIPDDDVLLVSNAITIREDTINPQPGVLANIVIPNMWMKYSGEDCFVIERHNILTITELSEGAIEFYEECFEKAYASQKSVISTNKVNPERNVGYVSKIDDARDSLEKLFNKDSK